MDRNYYLLDFPDDHLDNFIADPASVDELLEEEAEFAVSLDRAWHGIHYSLTGDPEGGRRPLCYLMSGGRFINEARGIRCLKSAQVSAFNQAVAQISDADFRKRFDPVKFETARVFAGDNGTNGDANGDYLLQYFKVLKSFLAEASDNEVGILIWSA